MAIETQSRLHIGATLVRLWFLVYFGLLGFVPLGTLLFVLVTEGLRGKSIGLWEDVVMALIPIYAIFHISAFVGVLRKVSWAWTMAILVISLELVLHGVIALRPPPQADLVQKVFLLTCPIFSLILVAIPNVKTRLGSRVRAV